MFTILLPALVMGEDGDTDTYAVIHEEGRVLPSDFITATLLQRPLIHFSDFSFGWNPDPYTWRDEP